MIWDFLAHISKNNPSVTPEIVTARQNARRASVQDLISYSFTILKYSPGQSLLSGQVFKRHVLGSFLNILENREPYPVSQNSVDQRQVKVIIDFFAAMEQLLWYRASKAFADISGGEGKPYQNEYSIYLFLQQGDRTAPIPQHTSTAPELALKIFASLDILACQNLREFFRWLVIPELEKVSSIHAFIEAVSDRLEDLQLRIQSAKRPLGCPLLSVGEEGVPCTDLDEIENTIKTILGNVQNETWLARTEIDVTWLKHIEGQVREWESILDRHLAGKHTERSL